METKLEIDLVLEAAAFYREASIQGQMHSGHWDSRGTDGNNCPACTRAKILRYKGDGILADSNIKLPIPEW